MTKLGWPRLAAWACGALLAAGLVSQLAVHSPAHDEPIHLVSGLRLLRHRQMLDATHPALPFVLQALPLVPMDIDLHLGDDSWTRELSGRYYVNVLHSGPGLATILNTARVGAILMTLALAWLIHRWAARLWGPGGGLLALALAAVAPPLLADGAVVGNDVAVALTTLLALWAFRAWAYAPGPRTRWALALAFAAAQIVKFSSVLLAPILLVLYAVKRLLERRGLSAATSAPPRRLPREVLFIAGVTLAAIWAGSFFELASIAGDPMLRGSRGGQIAMQKLSRLPAWVLETPIPAYSHWKGLALQAFHSANHAAWDPQGDLFLLGGHRPNGWWYYFPVAFALKTPLPLFALWGLAGVLLWRRRADAALPRELPFELALLLAPPLLWLGACLGISINIGVRYLLPMYPPLFVLAGALAPLARGRRPLALAVGGLAALVAVGTARVHPHPHAYFNALAGGTERGWRTLNNSNLDWGQDLPVVKEYLAREGIQDAWLDLFGVLKPADIGIPGRPLPVKDPAALAQVRGTVVVSATRLTTHGRGEPLYGKLRATPPKARLAGGAVLVWDL